MQNVTKLSASNSMSNDKTTLLHALQALLFVSSPGLDRKHVDCNTHSSLLELTLGHAKRSYPPFRILPRHFVPFNLLSQSLSTPKALSWLSEACLCRFVAACCPLPALFIPIRSSERKFKFCETLDSTFCVTKSIAYKPSSEYAVL